MNDLLTFEEALTEAKKEKTSPKNKVGKAQSYFKKDWTFKKGNHYTELKDTKPLKADGFVAGENSFIIDKEKTMDFDGVTAYKAVDDELDRFVIYIDKDGNLYTDLDDKVGLYKKILK